MSPFPEFWRQRWQRSRSGQWLQWLRHRHAPEPGTIVLGQRRIYILPTRQGLGFALALLVGMSRMEVGAHSISEVAAGLLLGGAASAFAMASAGLPRSRIGTSLALLVALWVLITPVHVPPLPTHSMVTRLALSLSGSPVPHTRSAMHLTAEPWRPRP